MHFTSARHVRGALAVLIAVLVALRTIAAPVVMAAPEPGVMAICSGGQIYYVTLDGTPVDDTTPQPDPCPYHCLTLALGEIETPIPTAETEARRLALPLPQAPAISAMRARQNTPRAPPFLSETT